MASDIFLYELRLYLDADALEQAFSEIEGLNGFDPSREDGPFEVQGLGDGRVLLTVKDTSAAHTAGPFWGDGVSSHTAEELEDFMRARALPGSRAVLHDSQDGGEWSALGVDGSGCLHAEYLFHWDIFNIIDERLDEEIRFADRLVENAKDK